MRNTHRVSTESYQLNIYKFARSWHIKVVFNIEMNHHSKLSIKFLKFNI